MSRELRLLHRYSLLPRGNLCVLCANTLNNGQRRDYAAPKAPSTRRALRAQKAIPITPDYLQQKQHDSTVLAAKGGSLREARKEFTVENPGLERMLGEAAGTTREDDELRGFLISNWANEADLEMNRVRDWQAHFEVSLEAFDVSLDEIHNAARHLHHGGPFTRLGWRLLALCGRMGHPESTIFVMSRYLRQDKVRPGVLRTREAAMAMERLVELSKADNHRALALRGMIALYKGDAVSAIRYLELAMKGAVAFADEKIDGRTTPLLHRQQHDELSAPWIELAVQYYYKGRYREAEKTFKVGMDLDDPQAYFTRAALERKFDPEYSLRWLLDMTKAAASGHVLAAVELAKYYADAEPHPLPRNEFTATSVPSNGRTAFTRSPWERLTGNISSFLTPPTVSPNPEDHIEQYAAFAQTPEERIKHSMAWLSIASAYNYAPANILKARLYLNKYIFRSQNFSLEFTHPELYQEKKDHLGGVENPFYDVGTAVMCLALIFHLDAAFDEAERLGDATQAKRILAPWSTFPDVYDLFGNPDLIKAMLDEAKEIANIAGIDIVDMDGVLLYKHQGDRGRGVSELIGLG